MCVPRTGWADMATSLLLTRARVNCTPKMGSSRRSESCRGLEGCRKPGCSVLVLLTSWRITWCLAFCHLSILSSRQWDHQPHVITAMLFARYYWEWGHAEEEEEEEEICPFRPEVASDRSHVEVCFLSYVCGCSSASFITDPYKSRCCFYFIFLKGSQRNMLHSLFSPVSTATHHLRCHPACTTAWWTESWAMPSKLGATQLPWISVECWQTTKGRQLEGISGCPLTACFTMTGTLLMGRVAPWPTPSSPAGGKWLETHTLMIKRSGAMKVGISSSLFKWKWE